MQQEKTTKRKLNIQIVEDYMDPVKDESDTLDTSSKAGKETDALIPKQRNFLNVGFIISELSNRIKKILQRNAPEPLLEISATRQEKATEEEYTAPAPKRTTIKLTQRVVNRILFPPILLWDAIKFTTTYFASSYVGKLMVTSQNIAEGSERAKEEDLAQGQALAKLPGSFTSVLDKTNLHDGIQLQTLTIKSKQKRTDYYVIYVPGRNETMQQLTPQMVSEATELGYNAVGFNHRNVRGSTKKSIGPLDDLVTDTIAQVNRLIEQGVDPKKIILKGNDVGAHVATQVVKHFKEHKFSLNLFNRSGISSFTNFVVGHLRTIHVFSERRKVPQFGENDTTLGIMLGTIAKPFISLGLRLTGWEKNGFQTYKKVGQLYKEYIVIKPSRHSPQSSSSTSQVQNTLKDNSVKKYSSLHSALKAERTAHKEFLDDNIEKLEKITVYPLIMDYFGRAKDEFKAGRERLASRKMEAAVTTTDVHSLPLSDLQTRGTGKKGTEYFDNFFLRIKMRNGPSSAQMQTEESTVRRTY